MARARLGHRRAALGSVDGSGCGVWFGLFLSARPTRFGLSVGLTRAVALAFDGDHVGVMDDAIDEGGGAGGVGEDAGPVTEGEIGGEYGAFLLVAAADDLEEQVGVSIVEGEEANFVEDK